MFAPACAICSAIAWAILQRFWIPITTQFLPTSTLAAEPSLVPPLILGSSPPQLLRTRFARLMHHTRVSSSCPTKEVLRPVSVLTAPVTTATGIPVFDGHNDTLLDLPLTGR